MKLHRDAVSLVAHRGGGGVIEAYSQPQLGVERGIPRILTAPETPQVKLPQQNILLLIRYSRLIPYFLHIFLGFLT